MLRGTEPGSEALQELEDFVLQHVPPATFHSNLQNFNLFWKLHSGVSVTLHTIFL